MLASCGHFVRDEAQDVRVQRHLPQAAETAAETAPPPVSEPAPVHTPAHTPAPVRRSIPPRRLTPPEPAVQADHETTFTSGDKGRACNITLAVEAINGAVVQPGAIFSYNDTLGPTIESRGYKKSVIFVDGEKDEGFGGGVCQVSSTLHGAALAAGMTIVERHNHSLPVGYAEPGQDAATSYGVIDFRFKNPLENAVQILATVQDGVIHVSVEELR
jgi:vancomycin resistance protein YoaR